MTTDSAETPNWVAVWDSAETLGGTLGIDLDILVALSTDYGATWTTPAALNTNATSDLQDDELPQVTTDGLGSWVAVWQSRDSLGGTIGTDLDILVARSTDNGATWTAPAPLDSNAGNDCPGTPGCQDRNPQVATDSSGNWLVAWHSGNHLGNTIDGDFDILVVRSTDNGATWTAPAALNANAASDTGPDILAQVTTDGAGHWVAVWQSGDTLNGQIGNDYDILVARSTDNGATWTPPLPLNSSAASDGGQGHDSSPQVTTDGLGNWVAVWQSNESFGPGNIEVDYDILVARSTDNGVSWTPLEVLNSNAWGDYPEDDTGPQVTTDGAGNWVAVWTSSCSLGGTIGTDKDVLAARSADNGATWTAARALNTNASSDSGDDSGPQATTDAAGNWVVVWGSNDPLGGTIGLDLDILASLGSPGSCGDGLLDLFEDCDDGNTADGDCCSASCVFESSGSPCAEDGNVCTDEECDGAGTCTHPYNTASCDDDLYCNGTDTCSGGTCSVHTGDPCPGGPACAASCNDELDNCFDPSGTPCTEDGNVCTDDECNGAGACTHPNNTAGCDDGEFCNGSDTCSGGLCVVHVGDPCAGGPECENSCNEATEDCYSPVGASCTDDGGVCTDDECNGVGTCTHPYNTASCDDEDACTTGDTCSDGSCVGGPPPNCDDTEPCTIDSCDTGVGCQHDLIDPCTGDDDDDGMPNEVDECSALEWSEPPASPPSALTNQNPAKCVIILKNLEKPGLEDMIVRGFFNPADEPNAPLIQPHVDGVHARLENAGFVLLDVSIPGDAGVPGGDYSKGLGICGDTRDGWKLVDKSATSGILIWKYLNKSGLIPAAGDTFGSCTGDAKGILGITVKYIPKKGSYQYLVKTKDRAFEGAYETPPLTRMQFDLALGAQPVEGTASTQAMVGQCAEAVFSGDPTVPETPRDENRNKQAFCKRAPKTGTLKKIICKGL